MPRPTRLQRQRRQVREEFREHVRNVKFVAKEIPRLLLKQEWTVEKALAIMCLGLYTTGFIIGGTILYGAIYIGLIEA